MATLIKFNGVTGMRLLRIGRYQVELWWCPKGVKIPYHVHNLCDSWIIHLFGKTLWSMMDRCKIVTLPGWNRVIPAGVPHALQALTFCAFLNVETWTSIPSSASVDFHLTS